MPVLCVDESTCKKAEVSQGDALAQIVAEAIDNPEVFVFGELVALTTVQQLKSTHAEIYAALEIFAHGTLKDYKQRPTLPALTAPALLKLRLLTILSVASAGEQRISYARMSDELDLHDTRLLEDVVIHGVYLDLFKAKIDQRKEEIRVRACVGRDPRPAAFVKMVEKLTKWSGQQADALQTLKEMIEKSDSKVEAERTSAAASQKKKPKSYSSTKPPHHVKSSRKGKEARTSAH